MPLPRPAGRAARLRRHAFVAALAPAVVLPFPLTAAAQAATADPSQRLVVTGTRTPLRIDQALAEVTVIERAQIEAAAGRTLTELLAAQPGLQAWAAGGPGKATSVSMRGLEARHTLLLVDGVRLGSATLGLPSFENLPLEAIERIEIVRGPLSALYGSDAVGGVVQVFTRRGRDGVQAQAQAAAGTGALYQLGAALQAGGGGFDVAVQAQALRSRGYSATNPRVPFGSFNADDDGLDQDSASLRAGAALPGGWRLEARALHSEGTARFDDGPGADARTGLVAQVLALQATGPLGANGSLGRSSLTAARSTDELQTLATASAFTPLGTTATVQRQLAWEHTAATPLGTLLLLAERTEQRVSRPGAAFSVSDRSIDALALGVSGQAGPHHWQAALRRDRNSQFGRPGTGSLGYGFDLTPQWRVAASAGTSFVAPSFNQLYFPNFGNPRLLPERGRHREASLRWADAGQEVRATWFEHRIRGYIPSGPLPANVPLSTIDGFALAWDGSGPGGLSFSASAEWLDPRNATAGSANAGRVLPRRARETLRLAAQAPLAGWTVGAALRQVGARFDDPANTLRLPRFAVADLSARRELVPGWTLAVKLNNVADRRYETVYGYDQAGREWLFTLRVDWR